MMQALPHSLERAEEAKVAMKTAVDLDPNSFEAFISLGNLYLDQFRDPKTASEWYGAALNLDPHSYIAYSNLGSALMQEGKESSHSDVIFYFKEALKLNPNEAISHNDLAFALMQQGLHAEAIPSLEEALRLQPHAAQVEINLATSRAFIRRSDDVSIQSASCDEASRVRSRSRSRDEASRLRSKSDGEGRMKRAWRACDGMGWVEADIDPQHRLRFVSFGASLDTINQESNNADAEREGLLSVLGFLEDQPASTAPGGHALLSQRAYRWSETDSLECVVDGKRVSAKIRLDPPHSLKVECVIGLPPSTSGGRGRLVIRLRDTSLNMSLDIHLCEGESVEPSYGLSVCTMPLFRPLSSELLIEWIQYHLVLGVEHFYVLDRFGSFKEALSAYIAQGRVTHVPWDLFTPNMHHLEKLSKYYDQVLASTACLMWGARDEWIASIDPDEYIHPGSSRYQEPGGLRKLLDTLSADTTEVCLPNMIFPFAANDMSLRAKKEGRMIQNAVYRQNQTVKQGREKSIVRPKNVDFMWAHFASSLRCGFVKAMKPSDLRVNHYTWGHGGTCESDVCTEDQSVGWILGHLPGAGGY